MQSLYIVGAGGHSKIIRDAVNPNEFRKVYYLVQEKFISEIHNQTSPNQISSFENEIKQEKRNFICAVGDIFAREKLFNIALDHSWIAETICHQTSTISKSAIVGKGCFVGANVIINPDSHIGNNCIVNTGAIVEHDCIVEDHVNISPSATICGSVKISRNVLIGAGSVILPGVKIGECSVIGAGAVVTSNVQHSTTVSGVPASPH